MRLAPVPSVPEIRLYQAHPGSGLRRLLEPDDDSGAAEPQPPYWAYAWAGGAVLARYVLDRPSIVAGKRVLDLGAGSGLVGIAAAKAGARAVTAAEIDRNGLAAIRLNVQANGVAIQIRDGDVTAGAPPAVDLVLAGDVFYARDVGQRMMPFLDRCLAAGIDVLVGDPGRAWLPRPRLCLLGEYHVPDVGGNGGSEPKPSAVFALVAENVRAVQR
ncbi:methyltransferase [Mesorhizobium sp. VK25A]|uniref:Methyltransferase n=1 Tax=Mesorhizobium vachelliae TaxID=3072309 RepID=A0ABU5A5A7_9HYPH|nr:MULTISPECIES: methyltransferase [unclassified Mesorhizobium]MDX8532859.1 methyltransferase [Mesorhizobium sp. VK25D]MDX8544635.1 methyltransferase [Mesorhizobium sp. VK25A]